MLYNGNHMPFSSLKIKMKLKSKERILNQENNKEKKMFSIQVYYNITLNY